MGMSLSVLRPSNVCIFFHDYSYFQSGLLNRLTWRSAVMVGVPLAVGLAGISYFAWQKRAHSPSDLSPDSIVVESTTTPEQKALALKNKGNKFFKCGRYQQALELYDMALEVCPEDSVQNRAFLYQNRAAAKENLALIDDALADCCRSLDLSPTYIKALARRSNLLDKLGKQEEALDDISACVMLEKFANTTNIMCMDRMLKQVAQTKAKTEHQNMTPSLPSHAFIQIYFSAFAWDPFVAFNADSLDVFIPATLIADCRSYLANCHDNSSGWLHHLDPLLLDKSMDEADYLVVKKALSGLDDAIDAYSQRDYQASANRAKESVDLFKSIFDDLAKWEPLLSVQPPSSSQSYAKAGDQQSNGKSPSKVIDVQDEVAQSGGDLTSSSSPIGQKQPPATNDVDQSEQQDVESNTLNGHSTSSGHDDDDNVSSLRLLLPLVKAAYSQAVLLHANFLLITDSIDEARRCLTYLESDQSQASNQIKVNALIKSATLSMSVDQDFAACLYKFESAQSTCPECPDVYLQRGQVHLMAEQINEALADFNMAVKLKPEFSVAQSQRLFTLYKRALVHGNLTEAESRVEELRRLVNKYPSCGESRSLLSQVLADRESFDEAYDQMKAVINLVPDSGVGYAHIALLVLRWKTDRQLAVEWLHKGAKADPQCEFIFELLGQMAVERGDLEEALTHFEQAVSLARSNSSLANVIAMREGVATQLRAATKYNISLKEIADHVRAGRQQGMLG